MITHKLIYTGEEYIFITTIELPFRLIDGDDIDSELIKSYDLSETDIQKGNEEDFKAFLEKEGFFMVRSTKILTPGIIEVEIH